MIVNRSYMPKKMFGAEFTLAIGCKLQCKYCPQEKLVRTYINRFGTDKLHMSFEDFKVCLEKIEPGAGISIGGMVEPFHNKECAKMIRYAYEQGFQVGLDTSLQGMTEEDFCILKDVKFDHLQLHIPDREGNSRFNVTEQYIDIFEKVNQNFKVAGYSCHGNPHESIKEKLNDELLFANHMINRAGNLTYSELDIYDHDGKLICGSGSIERTGGYLPEILPNGTVILCCMDYGLEHILGNILKEDWNEILQGSAYRQFEDGLEDKRIPLLCRHCSAALQKENNYFDISNMLGPNAIKVSRLIGDYTNGILSDSDLENRIGIGGAEVIKRLTSAENRCVFGVGKLFEDNYFNSLWHNVIKANVFSDNDKSKWGTEIRGIKCVAPEELHLYENLIIVVYIKNAIELYEDLHRKGFQNIIDISQLFNLFD